MKRARVRIEAKRTRSFRDMMRDFKDMCEDYGIPHEYKEHEFHIRKGDRQRRKRAQRIRIQQEISRNPYALPKESRNTWQ